MAMSRLRLTVIVFAALVVATAGAAVPGWRAKVAPAVLDGTGSGGQTEMLVVLAEQAPLGAADRLEGKVARGRLVVERLRAAAGRSQTPLLRLLTARGVPHRAFWVANMVWVRGDRALVEALARRSDVARLDANPRVRLAEPVAERAPVVATAVEWNITMVGAPDLWALGPTGQGVVLAGQDTGYDWMHPALESAYRGWNGATASHDYNWHDAIHSGGGSCGADSPVPCDDYGHGTHTMGTMVGDDGGSNQIGMAPGARWIGCRNMDQGAGTPATYAECFQFFLAPTDLAGENPRPDLAPDVINDSWVCTPTEGCTDPDILRTVVENVRAAGIVVVASAGNSGPTCSSVVDPPAIYDASFSVGAVDSSDTIASFSSRGPVTADGSGRLKPEVVAPGVNVRSSFPGGGYATDSGTSMAGPHVAGLAALLISACPGLRGDVDAIEADIEAAALPLTTSETCGGLAPGAVPNNTYGFGRIRAVLPEVCPLFLDGFETGTTERWSAVAP